MWNSRAFSALLLFTAVLSAHPMGNFSVNHYSALELRTNGLQIIYILDLAEIPTFELFQQWGINTTDTALIHQKTQMQALMWLKNLSISVDGRKIVPLLKEARATLLDGAAGMSVMRVVMTTEVAASPGALLLQDENYRDRTGWKEIVIRRSPGVTVSDASHSEKDLSAGLTVYPADLTLTPPQDLRASVRWQALTQAKIAPTSLSSVRAVQLPAPAPKILPSFAVRQPSAPGTVNRGDFLSRMLHEKRFGFGAILIGLLVAFCLGAMHALSPGHGKTIVAAYLVGSRGTLKHALFLGLMVTFTHTISVFLLGFSVLFFQSYVAPDRIIPVLGAVSGISIACIGAWLLYQRGKALISGNGHSHIHHHAHDADHHHHGHHHHDHHQAHAFHYTHTHDGHTHSHAMPEQRVTIGSLVALGASGGLVPCPSALILLLSAIALNHAALGLGLLVAFSSGLALVLMAIGAMVLYAKHLLPKTQSARQHPAFRLLPVFSSVVVIVLGLFMALTALGVVQPLRLLS